MSAGTIKSPGPSSFDFGQVTVENAAAIVSYLHDNILKPAGLTLIGYNVSNIGRYGYWTRRNTSAQLCIRWREGLRWSPRDYRGAHSVWGWSAPAIEQNIRQRIARHLEVTASEH